MADAADYRKRAADCARRAGEADDEFHRKNFQQLADMWAEMARKADERAGVVPEIAQQQDVEDALATIREAR